jgi:hypothetical protein
MHDAWEQEPTAEQQAELDAAIERVTDRILAATEQAAAQVLELREEAEICELERWFRL